MFVFFVGPDQMSELFLAIQDYPQLRFDSGSWVKGGAVSKPARGKMLYNQENIVYVWNKESKPIHDGHYHRKDPSRRVVALFFPDDKLPICILVVPL